MTDKEIKAALDGAHPPTCVREVYGALGCSPVCGGCAGLIKRLMDAHENCACALDPRAEVEEKEAA
jgi:bacterioferritin-associated ferredoxin